MKLKIVTMDKDVMEIIKEIVKQNRMLIKSLTNPDVIIDEEDKE